PRLFRRPRDGDRAYPSAAREDRAGSEPAESPEGGVGYRVQVRPLGVARCAAADQVSNVDTSLPNQPDPGEPTLQTSVAEAFSTTCEARPSAAESFSATWAIRGRV